MVRSRKQEGEAVFGSVEEGASEAQVVREGRCRSTRQSWVVRDSCSEKERLCKKNIESRRASSRLQKGAQGIREAIAQCVVSVHEGELVLYSAHDERKDLQEVALAETLLRLSFCIELRGT